MWKIMQNLTRKKKKLILGSCMALMLCVAGGLSTLAAPSISSLHDNKEQTVIEPTSTDGTNTAEILSKTSIYTNEAVSDQYKQRNKDGKLVPTPLSDVIELGAGTRTEINQNGSAIPNEISTVEEMIHSYCAAANVSEPSDKKVNLSDLDQLTYLLDFKYQTTDYRVIAGAKVDRNGVETTLDNGMIVAKIDGGEIIRAADIKDYLIIQIDAKSGEIHYLTMQDYDADTGKYTVKFPCIGPYIITQVMK